MRRRTISLCLILIVAVSLGAAGSAQETAKLPKLVDLGSTTCLPCKLMEPILKELTVELAGIVDVEFINVNEKPALVDQYRIEIIPTQVFLGADGKELFRHEGFYSKSEILAQWRGLGVAVPVAAPPAISRWTVPADARPKQSICYMCDRDIAPKTAVVVKTDKGDVRLCSPHCFFVMVSSYTGDCSELERTAFVTDYKTGQPVPLAAASYLHVLNDETGKPFVMAFAKRAAALAARRSVGGSILTYPLLQAKELATRCGFCDRGVYPQDAALVRAGGVYTYGCCSHCAMGVAARTGKDIEVHQPDALTGQMIVVKTLDGKIASIDPPTAVAWYGQRTKPDGKHASAGCFHQGFFVSPENLQRWLELHPLETGELITIEKALADKMALSAEQIKKACKIGECAPK